MMSENVFDVETLVRRAQEKQQQQVQEVMKSAIEVCVEVIRMQERRRALKQKRKSNNKRIWVRPWVERRQRLGGEVLLKELSVKDASTFTNTLRMNCNLFYKLLRLIEDSIQKQNTRMRNAISAELKLQVTLRYLATGDSFKSLSLFFRLPVSTISTFLPDVLVAIHRALGDYIKLPRTPDDWKKIAQQFGQVWNFPKCCGAIDGKHITIRAPSRLGSDFFNYKGHFSTVLLAIVDGNYNFIYVNVGSNGRTNDAGLFQDSALYRSLEDGTLNLPPEHVIVGDSAFPLKKYLMKPYAYRNGSCKKTVFNYRLSQARRIVGNAFGILASQFRVFMRPIDLKKSTTDKVVLAACALHNWLRVVSPTYLTGSSVDQVNECTGAVIPGQWRMEINELPSARNRPVNNYTEAAKTMRDKYADYFWGDGAIPMQWKATGILPGSIESDVDDPDTDFEDD